MGEIIEVTIIMLIVAFFAFAPLGYLIHMFTVGNGKGFGKTDPNAHSEEAGYQKMIDNIMKTILGG